ncbi:MAG: 1-deoxy-D-xylulose-5-phosphate reductoisomerase, partial [Propionibacterium sp.]|nr:1-deoxy-D-xylulose-5-phosphate reductoisomerase [Propionibacterium sp.]
MRNVVILGSTGSVGTQAVDVITTRPEQFNVVGLSAGGSSLDLLTDQVLALDPDLVALADPQAAASLRARVPGVEVWDGPD